MISSAASVISVFNSNEIVVIGLKGLGKMLIELFVGIISFPAPAGSKRSTVGVEFVIGKYFVGSAGNSFDGTIKDVRVWNRVLTNAEIATIYGGGDIDDGLLFQGPVVRTAELPYFEDLTLTTSDKLLDNVYGRVGTPHGSVITRLIP